MKSVFDDAVAAANKRSTPKQGGSKRVDQRPDDSGWSVRWLGAIIGLVSFLLYLTNLHVTSSGDNVPGRLLPFSILREVNINLDEFTWLHRPGEQTYYVHERGGHWYPATAIVQALVVTPAYVLPAWYLERNRISYDDVRARLLIVVMERLSAAALTAFGVSVFFIALCRVCSRPTALAVTVMYAIGSNTWGISSQGLWTHTLSELCLVILSATLLLSEPGRTPMLGAGAAAALGVAARPQVLPFAVLAAVFVGLHHRRRLFEFLVIPGIGAAALISFNFHYFNGLAGQYWSFQRFTAPIWDGIVGLLFSPNRGLFVYTPVLIFAGWGALRVWRENVTPWLRYATVGVVAQLLLYAKFAEWWGGFSYGPRYLTEALPVLFLLLAVGIAPIVSNRAWRTIIGLFGCYGIVVQAVGVYFDNDDWNRFPVSVDSQPERVWDVRDSQILRTAQTPFRGTELASLLWHTFSDPQSAQIVPFTPNDLAYSIELDDVATRYAVNEKRRACVTFTNRSGVVWPAFNGEVGVRHVVILIAQWFNGQRPLAGFGEVARLPKNLAPGESASIEIPLYAPARPGSYGIRFSVAQAIDGEHGTASQTATRVNVEVTP